jgi:hypothetical protein
MSRAWPQKRHPIRTATVVLSGFQLRFTETDHNLLEEKISISDVHFESNGKLISFRVNFLLRDNSGTLDDPFAGFADVVIIADVS